MLLNEIISPIRKLLPLIVARIQKEYDEWEQDEDGVDLELGVGGICQNFAEIISEVLNENGIEAATVSSNIGEQHVWTVARFDDGVYSVDIPYCIYERGGGYSWQKVQNVKFTEKDITIERLSADPKEFENYVD